MLQLSHARCNGGKEPQSSSNWLFIVSRVRLMQRQSLSRAKIHPGLPLLPTLCDWWRRLVVGLLLAAQERLHDVNDVQLKVEARFALTLHVASELRDTLISDVLRDAPVEGSNGVACKLLVDTPPLPALLQFAQGVVDLFL